MAKKDVQCISASTSCNYLFSSQKQHFFCCRGPSRISHVLVCSIPTVFPEVFQGRKSHLSKYSCGDGLRPNKKPSVVGMNIHIKIIYQLFIQMYFSGSPKKSSKIPKNPTKDVTFWHFPSEVSSQPATSRSSGMMPPVGTWMLAPSVPRRLPS